MACPVEPRTYQRNECVTFRKTDEPFGGLSNRAPGYPLCVNGLSIMTADALYQACRWLSASGRRSAIDHPADKVQ